jgi:hypothetical protein
METLPPLKLRLRFHHLIVHITAVVRGVGKACARRQIQVKGPATVCGSFCKVPFVQFPSMFWIDGTTIFRARTFTPSVVFDLRFAVVLNLLGRRTAESLAKLIFERHDDRNCLGRDYRGDIP